MPRILYFYAFILTTLFFSSCQLMRSNLMLKTPKDFVYDQISDSMSKQNYKIEPNNILQIHIYSNDGFEIIDLANKAVGSRLEVDYLIDSEGEAKLPLAGKIKLAGLTVREAEVFLQDVYDKFYVKPFITIKIENKRVTVFPGNGGLAKVITLANNNTTVIEALALTGGIQEDGKAYKVKLIRNDGSPKPKVYLMDLSRIEGIAAGNSVVLANDIIYVEPRYRFAKTLVSEITPILSLLTSSILIYTLFVKK